MIRRGATVRWPADRFYWALVDAPSWRREGQLPLGLQTEVADDLPEPIEDLHIVGSLDDAGRLIVCAVPILAFDELHKSVVSLTAESPPACLGDGLQLNEIEMLVGDFEPRPIRRAKTIRHTFFAVTVLLTAMFMATGLSRRSAHWNAELDEVKEARLELTERIAPGIPFGALRLEVARLQAVATQRQDERDASLTLQALLKNWPLESSASTHSITITDSSVSVAVSIEGNATPFLRAVQPPDGWVLEDPRLHTSDGRTRLTLVMQPLEDPGS